MSDTRKCHREYSGDTGYGATMGASRICEDASPRKVEKIAPVTAPEEARDASSYALDECYGLTGLGGVVISMLWRHLKEGK